MVLRRLLDLWRPRTELGRRIKHKLKYGLGSEPPLERLGLRRKYR